MAYVTNFFVNDGEFQPHTDQRGLWCAGSPYPIFIFVEDNPERRLNVSEILRVYWCHECGMFGQVMSDEEMAKQRVR